MRTRRDAHLPNASNDAWLGLSIRTTEAPKSVYSQSQQCMGKVAISLLYSRYVPFRYLLEPSLQMGLEPTQITQRPSSLSEPFIGGLGTKINYYYFVYQ